MPASCSGGIATRRSSGWVLRGTERTQAHRAGERCPPPSPRRRYLRRTATPLLWQLSSRRSSAVVRMGSSLGLAVQIVGERVNDILGLAGGDFDEATFLVEDHESEVAWLFDDNFYFVG